MVADQALVDQCRECLPVLADLARRPATPEEVVAIIARRFAVWPQPQRSEGEWTEWWGAYVETLDGLPQEAIDAGLAAHLRRPDSQFLPKPGELRTAALSSVTPNGTRYVTARKVVDAAAEQASVLAARNAFALEAPKTKRMAQTPEDRAWVRDQQAAYVAGVDSYLDALRAKAPPPNMNARPHEMAPGRHVSRQMVELQHRQLGLPAPVWPAAHLDVPDAPDPSPGAFRPGEDDPLHAPPAVQAYLAEQDPWA